MKDVLDSIKLQVLRRIDYMREHNFLRETHSKLNGTQSVPYFGWGMDGHIVYYP